MLTQYQRTLMARAPLGSESIDRSLPLNVFPSALRLLQYTDKVSKRVKFI